MNYETDLREQSLEVFLRGLAVRDAERKAIKPKHMLLNEPTTRAVEYLWSRGTVPVTGLDLLTHFARHHKRTSKRRWKARVRLGQWVPWRAVVEHQLQNWNPLRGARDWPPFLPVPTGLPLWDRDHERELARSALILFRTQLERRAMRILQTVVYGDV
jgi:hypothetical protein